MTGTLGTARRERQYAAGLPRWDLRLNIIRACDSRKYGAQTRGMKCGNPCPGMRLRLLWPLQDGGLTIVE